MRHRYVLLIVGSTSLFACESNRPPQESCGGCTIALIEDRVVGGAAEEFSPTLESTVVRVGDVFFVAPVASPGRIGVVDGNGQLLRTIGGVGRGPGEWQAIRGIYRGAADSILVFDQRLMTLTLLNAEGAYVRSMPVQDLVDDVEIPAESRLVIAARTRRADQGPVQLLDASGNVVSTFGRQADERLDPLSNRRLAVSAAGILLAAHTNEYTIDRFGLDGTPLGSIRHELEWFPRVTVDDMRSAAQRGEIPRFTMLRDVHAAQTGIRVLIDRASEEWQPPPGHDPATSLPFSEVAARVEHILQLLDASTGEVIASLNHVGDEVLLGFLDADHVYGVRETRDGGLEMVILRFVIER